MALHRSVPHLFVAFLTLTSCVSLEQLPPGSLPEQAGGQGSAPASFPDIDPGGTSITSLHFTLRGYTEGELRTISQLAESLYNKVGNDTGLYSFLASGSYSIVVYRDRDEYLAKTRLPSWSRAVTSGNAIYLYPGSDLEPALIHEMTHLIFNSYMGDKTKSLRWLNEGLAMFEERSRMSEVDRSAFQNAQGRELRSNKMPFSQMVFFTPLTEEQRRVDQWYLQVESVVAYLLAQAPSLNFANMMNAIRQGQDVDAAIAQSYPGKFGSLAALEQSWKYSI